MYHEIKKERGKKTGTTVLLSAPSITIPKWKAKEIIPTIPNHAKVTMIESTQDALKLLKKARNGHKPNKNDIEFYLIGLDRAKLGHDPAFSGIWRREKNSKHQYSWHCPRCMKPIEIEVEKDTWAKADYYDFVEKGTLPSLEDVKAARKKGHITNLFIRGHKAYRSGILMANGLPDGSVKKWRVTGTPKTCSHCNEKLWRPALKNRHETRNKPRYNSSRILKKTKMWFDFFCQDEVQMTKAEDSGRGDAFAQMCRAAKKKIFLTGTLTTGKATSIKEIIARSDFAALKEDGFDHNTGSVQWARRYGVLREIFEVDEEDRGVTTRRKRKQLQPKEEAGIAPQLVTNHILHKAAFTELGDLGLPLVELHEIPEIIKMDPEHQKEYTRFHQLLFDECKKTGQWGKFIPATINYGDRPDKPAVVKFKDKGSGAIYEITAPALPGRHAKLRWIINRVKKELAENRGCIIYNKYTDSYMLNEYVKEHLKEEGIHAEILSSSTSTLQRFEWLQKQEEKGTMVLITNLSLVEVGLDLMPWPTIIYNQSDYDINKVRQSGRRHWRIGQHRECRTFYPVYEGTQQMAQFETLMQKRGHAMLVEGRIDQSELAEFCKDSNNAMAADIANCLADTDIAEKWKKLAAKDIDDNLEIVKESDFKGLLEKRMQELAEITLSKCLPIPLLEPQTVNHLDTFLHNWISTFSIPVQQKLKLHLEEITKGILDKKIKGFHIDEKSLYFDEVEVFGFAFVDEFAISEHILSSIKTSSTNTILEKPQTCMDKSIQSKKNLSEQTSVEDFLSDCKLIEVTSEESKKVRGKKPIVGQLALDLFN